MRSNLHQIENLGAIEQARGTSYLVSRMRVLLLLQFLLDTACGGLPPAVI
jgi:hypothetical protein